MAAVCLILIDLRLAAMYLMHQAFFRQILVNLPVSGSFSFDLNLNY